MNILSKKTSNTKIIYKKRRFYTFLILLCFFIVSSFFSYKLYIIKKTKDLTFAIEYYTTRGNNESVKVLRVKSMKLIFSDNNSAIVQIEGLRKKSPHIYVSLKCHFNRNNFNSWVLTDIYLIEKDN